MKLTKKDEQTQRKIKRLLKKAAVVGAGAIATAALVVYGSGKLGEYIHAKSSAPTMGIIIRVPDFPRENRGDELSSFHNLTGESHETLEERRTDPKED